MTQEKPVFPLKLVNSDGFTIEFKDAKEVSIWLEFFNSKIENLWE